MFKKGLVLALACVLGVSSVSPVFAVEYETYTETGSYGSDVTMNIQSSFMVSIPKTIDLDVSGSEATATYVVGVKGEIEDSTNIKVVPDEEFTLTSEFGNTVQATTTQDKTKWESSEINIDDFNEGEGTVTAPKKVGTYKGTLNFNVEHVATVKVELKDASSDVQTANKYLGVSSNIYGSGAMFLVGQQTQPSSNKIVDEIFYLSTDVDSVNGGSSNAKFRQGYYKYSLQSGGQYSAPCICISGQDVSVDSEGYYNGENYLGQSYTVSID